MTIHFFVEVPPSVLDPVDPACDGPTYIEMFLTVLRSTNLSASLMHFFSDCVVSHSRWGDFNPSVALNAKVAQERLLDYPPPFGLRDTLNQPEQVQPGDRVLVLATTDNSELNSEAADFVWNKSAFVSIILVGCDTVEPEVIETLLGLAHGGFVFPQIQTTLELSDAIECLARHFFAASEAELTERSEYRKSNNQKAEYKPFIPLIPSSCVAQALLEDSWRWTRGLRVCRELFRGLKDIVVKDSGSVGLELVPSTNGWTVSQTHPPLSAIGIPIGSVLVGISGHRITLNTARDTLYRRMIIRPVCLTLNTQEVDCARSVDFPYIEELSAKILTYRSTNPYTTIPPKFTPSSQRPWKQILSKGPISLLITSCVVMLDDVSLARVGSTCKLASELSSHRIWRYVLRRIQTKRRPLFGINGEGPFCAKFATQLDALTPACFTHNSEFTKRLRAEGVALELLFVKMMLEIAASSACLQLSLIYETEGACSVYWFRIFLSLLTGFANHVGNGVSNDILTDAIEFLAVSAITDSVLADACRCPVTMQWIREWQHLEYSSS